MKKVALIFAITLLLSFKVHAETYYGIDIDKVYSQSDWSSKDKIKEIIDDYNIMLHFYRYNYENNINDYQNYVKLTLTVYGIAYCLNKYNIPAGTVCEQEKNAQVREVIKQYIETLLSQIEKQISVFSFIKDYK